jgi:aminomuconate-semialdehyde/2-hydroxymuconate-6-semialdehyde dehydrogenase
MQQFQNYINGRYANARSGRTLDVHEPATGQVYANVADSDEADVDAAVTAGANAFTDWSSRPSSERSRILLKLADLIDGNLERLALAESTDTGKPISLARSIDIPRSASNFRYFATAILHTSSELHEFDGGGVPAAQGGIHAINTTLRRPRGVAGLISPWNLPLYLLTWKIAPALATGNTVVCKPSEVTPATAALLGGIASEAGLPSGVLNIIHGRGTVAGGALVKHSLVPTISFTGSTGVGQWIGREAGERLKRVSLELGGKNPFIVCADADLDDAINTAARAAFTNQGQICLCGSRMIVHESIADRFIIELVERAQKRRIGDPANTDTEHGALVSQEHLAKVESYVELARSLGGRVLTGGSKIASADLPARCKRGYFFPPTVIDGLAHDCRVETEEIFGPVVTIQRFRTIDEAINIANCTPYGLAAVAFTRDLATAHTIGERIHAGIVWINCWMVRDLRTPFGGMKHSGVGREGGLDAIKFFTEPKNVCVRVDR